MLAANALATLLLTPFDPTIFSTQPQDCLSSAYYGTYGGQSLFLPTSECLSSSTDFLSSGTLVPSSKDVEDAQLVWVEEVAIEDGARGDEPDFGTVLDNFLESASIDAEALVDDEDGDDSYVVVSKAGQTIMDADAGAPAQFELLHRTPDAALLALSPELAQNLVYFLPRLWKFTPVPATPVEFIPVPSESVEPVRKVLASLKYEPVIAGLVESISVAQMKKDIEWLTGEDKNSPIVSRHSFAEGSRTAAAWIKNIFESTGADCELKEFLAGFAPNVICRYRAITDTTATVILSAHYDSRGSFGLTRAPGGDDDGSGTMSILSIARAIAHKRVSFKSNVEICAFAGEEQGLLGSRAYAREMRAKDANITVMIQADMLAYRVAGEPPQLGLPKTIGTTEVTQLVANISRIYSPELEVGFTAACCSDHQSFHEQGFPATQVFERAGPIADPMYHNPGDVSKREGYDFEQVRSIAKVQFATLLHAAGFNVPKREY